MSGRDITAVIGQSTYYEQVGTKRSFNDNNNDIDVYLVKITKAEDKSREGKFALIRSTKKAGDKYVTDITYGEQCDLLKHLNTPEKVTLNTRTFDGTAPVDNPDKQGTQKPKEITADKGWELNENVAWKELGASVPSDVKNACIAAAGTPPAVSNTDLGTVNADGATAKVDIKFDKPIVAANGDESISVKVNGQDKSLAKGAYTIAGDTLSINKTGIDALGITNATLGNKLIVNADQIADAADPTKKNVATGELVLKAKAPTAADRNPNPRIITSANQEFAFDAPIELTFENPLNLAPGKSLNSSNITIQEVDDAGDAVPGAVVPTDLSYAVDGSKLLITTPRGFTAQKKYQVIIQPGLFLKDDGMTPYEAQIGYTFKAITPSI